MSWWQKTRLTAVTASLVAVGFSFVLAIFVTALAGSAALNSMVWLAFSAFPLLVVVLIATLLRFQQRINLRSGGGQFGPPGRQK